LGEKDQELANASQRAQMMGSFIVRKGQNDARAAEYDSVKNSRTGAAGRLARRGR
jgi:NAD(P)H-hydrate repair Nnr-like enzyme with NAD(P)H-hydrate dehydratase domain